MLHQVTSAASLAAALQAALPGDTLNLAATRYGKLKLAGKTGLTFVGTGSAIFDEIAITSCQNLTFTAVEVDLRLGAAAQDHTPAVRIDGSQAIYFAKGRIALSDAPAGNKKAGQAIGRGVWAQKSKDVRVIGTEVTGGRASLFFNDSDGIMVTGCRLHHFRCTAVSGGGNTNVAISDNEMWHARASLSVSGDHGDFIHLYTTAQQAGASANVTISRNFLWEEAGTSIMGINLQDAFGKGYDKLTIDQNIIASRNGQLVRLGKASNYAVLNNSLLSLDPKVPGKIVLNGPHLNGRIDLNIVAAIGGNAARTNVAIGANQKVQVTNPAGADYAGRLFANPFAARGRADFAKTPAAGKYGA